MTSNDNTAQITNHECKQACNAKTRLSTHQVFPVEVYASKRKVV